MYMPSWVGVYVDGGEIIWKTFLEFEEYKSSPFFLRTSVRWGCLVEIRGLWETNRKSREEYKKQKGNSDRHITDVSQQVCSPNWKGSYV